MSSTKADEDAKAWANKWLKEDREFLFWATRFGSPLLQAAANLAIQIAEAEEPEEKNCKVIIEEHEELM